MGKLTDLATRAGIRSEERFEGRSEGDGLVLTWRDKRTAPRKVKSELSAPGSHLR